MNDTTQSNYAGYATSQTDTGIEVMHPPLDNFNHAGYPNNVNSFQEATESALLPSFQNATYLVQNVLQQLQLYIQENNELKESIRVNNNELQKKYKELLAWKENMKTEKAKLKSHYEKSRSTVVGLRNENAFLTAENTKLELRLNELKDSHKQSNDEGERSEETENADSEILHSKYVKTMEALEFQLKEALTNRDTLEAKLKTSEDKLKRMLDVNRQLQQKLKSYQQEILHMEALKREKYALDISYKKLVEELRASKESNKDMQSQMLQLMKDNEVYGKESEELKAGRQSLQQELNKARALTQQIEDALRKSKQDVQNLQYTKLNLEKKVGEKTQSLDELFTEYERLREENQKLVVERKQPEMQADYDNLFAKLISAEESLHRRDRDLKDMRERMRPKDEQIRKLNEEINFFKAQADVYKQDFDMEREDRRKLSEQLEQLKATIQQQQQQQPQQAQPQQFNGNRYDPMRR